jgi:hypothetical protein
VFDENKAHYMKGKYCSLKNNIIVSMIIWPIPTKPNILGPLRIHTRPATPTATGGMYIINVIRRAGFRTQLPLPLHNIWGDIA